MLAEPRLKRKAPSGTEYTLEYDGLYRWSREGTIAGELKGAFSAPSNALEAFERYCALSAPEKSSVGGSESLESLSKKHDLLKWAEEKEVEVPETLKQPSAIKKFLSGVFNA
jgi:hypothetical protein